MRAFPTAAIDAIAATARSVPLSRPLAKLSNVSFLTRSVPPLRVLPRNATPAWMVGRVSALSACFPRQGE